MTSEQQQTLTPFLLVTANVGSIFEDPSVMLKIWTQEFLNTVARLEPKFLALHCQEVGGKNYEESMKYVDNFVKLLMDSEELRLFDKVRIYLDEDYSLAENFTALGNFYFIHESLHDVLTWDFKEMCFVAVEGKEVFGGEIEDVPTKEKSKFPQDFFPECKWSRKGFLRTRWNLNGTVFDLVNIHLFHDASNFVAMESFPSEYTKTRQRALAYTLDRFHSDQHGPAPFFLFGDFNFRTDTKSVIQELVSGLKEEKITNGKSQHVEYRNSDSELVLTLGKKQFLHTDHQSLFLSSHNWLKKFDREVEEFISEIYEFPIAFPPSYPFVEKRGVSNDYMTTRCPAWCDRVLLSQTARPLINGGDNESSIEYGLIGKGSCMGDHKPVYLRGGLVPGAGRLSCCADWLMSSSKIVGNHDHCPQKETQVVFEVGGGDEEVHEPGRLPETALDGRFTQRCLVKRVNSASVVEVRVGLVKRASCAWRSRSVSVASPIRHHAPVRQVSSRLRIAAGMHRAASRYNSHHSSSEEEWFEEEQNDEKSAPVQSETPAANEIVQSSKSTTKCCRII